MAGVLPVLPAVGSLYAKPSCAKIISIILLTLASGSAAPASTNSDLWINPCTHIHQVRHARSAAETELKHLMFSLEQYFKEIKKLHHFDTMTQNTKFKITCPKINKLLRSINNASNKTEMYQNFYNSMMHLAEFIDTLRDIKIRTEAQTFENEKRREIYNNTKNKLRLTICEYNEKMKGQLMITPQIQHARSNGAMQCLKLHSEPDLSEIKMIDVQFFKKLKKFFKAVKKALKKQKRNSQSKKRHNIKGGKKRTRNNNSIVA